MVKVFVPSRVLSLSLSLFRRMNDIAKCVCVECWKRRKKARIMRIRNDAKWNELNIITLTHTHTHPTSKINVRNYQNYIIYVSVFLLCEVKANHKHLDVLYMSFKHTNTTRHTSSRHIIIIDANSEKSLKVKQIDDIQYSLVFSTTCSQHIFQ